MKAKKKDKCKYRKEILKALKDFFVVMGGVSFHGLTIEQYDGMNEIYHVSQELYMEISGKKR